MCPSVLMKDYTREQPAIAWAPITLGIGFEGEGAGEVGKPTFFFFFSLGVCVFFPPKKKKNPTSKKHHTQKLGLLQLFSSQLADKNYLA